MRHSLTGQIVPARCNSYLCSACSPLFQMTARHALEWGLYLPFTRHVEGAGIFVTLTEPPNAGLDLPGLAQRWKATSKRLRRLWGMTDYALVVEWQQRGALHPHIFARVPDQVADDLRDWTSRASYRRRRHELQPLAESLGWGPMVDAQAVALDQAAKLGQYGAKALSGYATKEAAERFKRAGAERVRPLRLSRGWYPGGLARARDQVLGRIGDERLPGRWERIRNLAAC